MSYDNKFRTKTIEYLKKGHTQEETSKTFGISTNTLAVWLRKLRQTGSLQDKKRKNTPKKLDPKQVWQYLSEYPDAYQAEIAKHFSCSQAAVSHFLKKMGYTHKKR